MKTLKFLGIPAMMISLLSCNPQNDITVVRSSLPDEVARIVGKSNSSTAGEYMMVFADWREYNKFVNQTNGMDRAALRALAESVPYSIPGIDHDLIYDEYVGQFSDEDLEYDEVIEHMIMNPSIAKITNTERIYCPYEGAWKEEEVTRIEPIMAGR